MQLGQSRPTSFGFNSIKFVDEASEQVFNRKNKCIKSDVLKQTLEEVKNFKPNIGTDVDVFITGVLKGTKYEATCLTYQEKGSLIRKGCVQINEIKDHTVKGIKDAFQKLAKQVDDIRLMEKECYEEKLLNKSIPRDKIIKPPFMR